MIILVIYYFITNYPKHQDIEQETFIISQFLWVRNSRAAWLLRSRSDVCRAALRVPAGLAGAGGSLHRQLAGGLSSPRRPLQM